MCKKSITNSQPFVKKMKKCQVPWGGFFWLTLYTLFIYRCRTYTVSATVNFKFERNVLLQQNTGPLPNTDADEQLKTSVFADGLRCLIDTWYDITEWLHRCWYFRCNFIVLRVTQQCLEVRQHLLCTVTVSSQRHCHIQFATQQLRWQNIQENTHRI